MTASLAEAVTIAGHVAELGCVSTTLVCGAFILLTLFGVKRNFGNYKFLLIIFATVGIFFGVLEVLLYPNVHSYNSSFYFYTDQHLFGREVSKVLLASYGTTYSFTMSLLTVQFVYRYWAVFSEQKLIWFKGWRFPLFLVLSVLVSAQWGLSQYYLIMMDDYSEGYIREEMLHQYGINISDVGGFCMVAYDKDGNIRWRNLSVIIVMAGTMFVQYSIIIYCSVMMYRKMEERLISTSESLRKLHRQLYKTLVLQVTCPTIVLFSPAIFIMFLPLFELEVSIPTGTFLCAFTLYPAMDSIIIMCIVSDYRIVLNRTLCKNGASGGQKKHRNIKMVARRI